MSKKAVLKKRRHNFIPKITLFIAGLSMIFTALAETQATFYVSPDGDDSNPGTETAPFKTIEAARDAVRAINSTMSGDIIVYLRGGTHRVANTIT